MQTTQWFTLLFIVPPDHFPFLLLRLSSSIFNTFNTSLLFVVRVNHILPFGLSHSVSSYNQMSYFLFQLYVFSVVSERKELENVYQHVL